MGAFTHAEVAAGLPLRAGVAYLIAALEFVGRYADGLAVDCCLEDTGGGFGGVFRLNRDTGRRVRFGTAYLGVVTVFDLHAIFDGVGSKVHQAVFST